MRTETGQANVTGGGSRTLIGVDGFAAASFGCAEMYMGPLIAESQWQGKGAHKRQAHKNTHTQRPGHGGNEDRDENRRVVMRSSECTPQTATHPKLEHRKTSKRRAPQV